MKRVYTAICSLVGHRLMLPAILAVFLCIYIGIAFFTDEALVTMVQLLGHTPATHLLFVLAVCNILCRMGSERGRYRAIRLLSTGRIPERCDGVPLQTLSVNGNLDSTETARILADQGYRVSSGAGYVAARRGRSLLAPRLLRQSALLLMFSGIALSLATRQSLRVPAIEGETLQVRGMTPRTIERINLQETPGQRILQRRLTVVASDIEGSRRQYGIYPPGTMEGRFFYPRFLSVAPLLKVATPEGELSEGYRLIMLYPPGREDEVVLGNGYRLTLAILQKDGAPDPFMAGRFDLHLKAFKGNQLLGEGELPFGGRLDAGGMSVSLLDARRFVVTDFVRDKGVFCIWLACAAAAVSLALYLPIKVLWPRREMFFADDGHGVVTACSYAEGGRQRHESLFLDLLDRACHFSRNR